MTLEDKLDVMLEIDGKTILKFALNYRAYIKGEWVEIYRVDNYHGFLHEQKFWRSREPVPISMAGLLSDIVDECVDNIYNCFLRYKQYYIKSKEDGR